MKVHELLNVPPVERRVEWLKDALQTAIELELSTLPPYLTAMWSIVDPKAPVYKLIRSIVHEEMLHFGLACNLLNAIGGRPEIASWRAVPKYPGPLPGDVRIGLIVPLTGLTPQLVHEVFMEIEYPQMGPVQHHHSVTNPTIGAFYTAIADALAKHPRAIKGTRQLRFDPPVRIYPIKSLRHALRAINEIKEQGEGTSKSPWQGKSRRQLAHYYAFGEIYHGLQFVRTGGKWDYAGPPIPFPEVYPVAQVPAEGYPNFAPATAFNQQYTQLLKLLQRAWNTGNAATLRKAVRTMGQLGAAGVKLIQTPLAAGGYNYGPPFHFLR
jgi:hypothetical protein